MAAPQNMPEEFLQYIWQNRLFTADQLLTTEGEPLVINDPGRKNSDSGPDFFNAKIKINDTLWAGNIEIHKKASDWQKHEHTNNKAYDNVILHVVETADTKVARSNGKNIPTFILKYPDQFKNNYRNLLDAQTWIACQNQFHKIDPVILQLGFNRLMIERLENKTQAIVERLEHNNNNWEETFFQILARMLGFKVNAVPFELLAKSLPIQILLKHKNSLFQLEALLFGNSGLLNQQLLGDDYFIRLRDEFSFLYKKYKLKGIEGHLWKFMRLRPSNFPTIRISQLAALIYEWQGMFSRIIETETIEDLKALLKVTASEYWNTHYNFNKASKGTKPKELGDTAANILIINVIVPFLFVYGEKQNKHELKNRALHFLEKLPAESNSIISKWKELGIQARSAFESQALLQLKNCYCESKKCLNCQIGVKLISSTQTKDD
ncbi:DUF2851 family protein [uncultured Draconibacterium sp.]|uniref:DUF2851 family protein n=1 Tax=uncultured Draconibacterium sp. TaxID=1573823 RepID=UPI002AA8C586|nr:DUF2851 family protein [uncultured Draconibacterium sp.]